jgi:hypothetical protein
LEVTGEDLASSPFRGDNLFFAFAVAETTA